MTLFIVYDEQGSLAKARTLRVGAAVPHCELDGEPADLVDLQPAGAPANLEDALETLEAALFPQSAEADRWVS